MDQILLAIHYESVFAVWCGSLWRSVPFVDGFERGREKFLGRYLSEATAFNRKFAGMPDQEEPERTRKRTTRKPKANGLLGVGPQAVEGDS